MIKETILLTGSTGFVGINLVRKYLDEGESKLVLLVRHDKVKDISAEQRIHELFGSHPNNKNIEVIDGDICLEHLASTAHGKKQLEQPINKLIHSAASTDMSKDDLKVEKTLRTNVNGTLNVLYYSLLQKDLELFAYISTAYVAGFRKGLIREHELINQGHKNPYELSKFLSELLVRNMLEESKRIILRPGVIVGNSKTGETQSFNMIYSPWRGIVMVKEKYEEYLKDKQLLPSYKDSKLEVPFRIVGDGNSRLNLIPVDSVAEMTYLLLKNPNNRGKTFHLTNPEDATLNFLKDQICNYLNITGVNFVSSLPIDSNTLEKFFYRNSRVLGEYMASDNPFFVRTNVEEALPDYQIPKPDEKLMQTLIKYADSVNWGRKS